MVLCILPSLFSDFLSSFGAALSFWAAAGRTARASAAAAPRTREAFFVMDVPFALRWGPWVPWVESPEPFGTTSVRAESLADRRLSTPNPIYINHLEPAGGSSL